MIRLLENLIETASELSLRSAWSPFADSPLGDNSIVQHYDFSGLPLPLTPGDGSGLGVSDTRTLTSNIEVITDVNVWFHLDNPVAGGAFNGDFYATLSHDSGFSVLLNRPGRRAGSDPDAYGYPDNGFSITLDDQAAAGDVHTYRLQLPLTEGGPPGLSHSTEVDPIYQAALTGRWAPDGRDANPADVTTDMMRTRMLSQFNGLPASGQWTLFVADVSPGGSATLRGWGLEITGLTVIPEPAVTMGCVGAVLLAWATRRRLGQRG
jgi:hypothetical protein